MISNTKSNTEIITYLNGNNDNKNIIAKSINKLTNIPLKSIYYILNNAEKYKHKDTEIYKYLKNNLKNIKKINIINRAINISNDISILLEDIKYDTTNLLDIGCGDCSISIELCKKLKIKEDVYCVDIKNWFGNYEEKMSCNFKYIIDNKIEHEDKKFDIIIAIHSLHHMKNFNEMIYEISRLIKKNGILIIKEHNCETHEDKLYIDIYHSIYELVLKDDINNNYINEYYAKYYSIQNLTNIFENLNFSLIKIKNITHKLKNFYAVYRKK